MTHVGVTFRELLNDIFGCFFRCGFEVLLGVFLMIPKHQSTAAKGLIILLICVYPANIHLAQTNGGAMNTTPLIAWGRLPVQFIFIVLAYWHSKY